MSFPLWGYATGAILLSLWSLSSAELSAGGKVWIQNSACAAGVDPVTLEVVLRGGHCPETVVSAAQTNLGRVANLEQHATQVRWSLPDR